MIKKIWWKNNDLHVLGNRDKHSVVKNCAVPKDPCPSCKRGPEKKCSLIKKKATCIEKALSEKGTIICDDKE